MENKKYEQLIDLIINEQEDKARELFHEIVVEKSREIYESIMDEEMMGEEEMVGEVGDLMDEISAEESGDVVEAEGDDADIEFDDEAEEAGDDLTQDLEAGHDEEAGEEPQDLDDVKDKFEDLLADFERILAGHEEEDAEEAGEEEAEGEEEDVMEAVQLQKVSVTHGDDGSNAKSVALNQPKVKTAGVNPVKFSGDSETVPTGPKGEKTGSLIGDVANTPGNKKAPALKAAPKAVTSQASGVNTKSPVSKG